LNASESPKLLINLKKIQPKFFKNMKNMKSWLCLAAALLVFWTACKKEDNVISGSASWPGSNLKASFVGQVLDENDQPVLDAVARVGSKQVKTDKNGVFIINDQSVNSARAIVTVFKAGYWDGSRTLFVTKNSQNRLTFRLLKKVKSGSITGSTGGKITVAGGAEIEFPANSLTRNGQVFSGKVNVSATFLDPSDANLSEKMRGALRGLETDGTEKGLQTFGMMGVELTDDSGQKIEIANGQKAKISMPIPANMATNAPQTIKLWHFSDAEGIWIEEGSATKIGSNYVGEVTHFSWWNCDQPFNAVLLKACLVDQNGQPLIYQIISLTSPSLGERYGWTDSSGCEQGLVPANEILVMNVRVYLPNCGAQPVVLTKNIGPFSADTDLGNIVVDLSATPDVQVSVISGRLVGCDGLPITNGYLRTNNSYFEPLDADGQFSYTQYSCDNVPGSVIIKGIDLDLGKESQEITLPLTPIVNFGDVAVCDDLDEYIRYIFDGGAQVTVLASQDSSFNVGVSSFYGYGPNQKGITGSFNHNNTPENNLPLNYIYLEGFDAFATSPNFTVKTNMTSYPSAVGQYLIGTFSGSFESQNPTQTHTVSGSYKIKRLF
jgi:hypothetical protein